MLSRHALVIGISEYKHLSRLDSVVQDIEGVARTLKQFGSYTVERYPFDYFDDEDRYEMLSTTVSHTELRDKIQEFLFQTAECSDALLYFSGHGLRVPSGSDYLDPKGYLCASNSEKDGHHALPLHDLHALIIKAIQQARISSLVVILDCCHAGMAIEYENSIELNMIQCEFSSPRKYALLAACRSHQQAYFEKGGQSVLTKAILEGLNDPKNANSKGIITFGNLANFVKTKLDGQGQQAIELSRDASDLEIIRHPQPGSSDTAPSDFPSFLADLNYSDEHFKFRKFLETSTKVGAFWLSGGNGAGQKWLSRCLLNFYCPDIREKKDKKSLLSMGAVNHSIYIPRPIKIQKIQTVWERIGGLFEAGDNPDLIIDKIYEYSCNKATVVLSLIGVENLAPDVVEQIWEQLWKPLASKARSRESDYPLILFLIDTGSKTVSSFDFLSGENEFQCNYLEKIINLKLKRFNNDILNQWARQQEDSLQGKWKNWSSLENFMQEIIDYNSEDESCNEEVLEKICRGCGYDEDIIQNMIIR